jgi:hypothetical protein
MDIKIQLLEYNRWLIGQVRNKAMNDLEAFSYLVERAAYLTPNCTECFVNNLGAILAGHSGGHPARDELLAQLDLVERDILYKLDVTTSLINLDSIPFSKILAVLPVAIHNLIIIGSTYK